ncbi:MAG: ABC transporter permease [Verrucomicrobia bacterium]|nr:ABC transporter permease [Planctomycetota bacterium]MBU4497577.1 ABC transporter permease [Verrucomicrobiota bacterium]MCG2678437.1 ABC transporter permease [Kiritimatiellia bacterium]
MNRILAIAGLTLRSAVRSKVFALLVILVMGGILGLPLIMKSDGTLAGQVQLFLQYTLGLAVALLSVMAVWAGAGAVSLEVEGRQIQLVAVKPVGALELWLGKWLGLMVINIVLLALTGAMILGLLLWTTRPSLLSEADRVRLREEILVARSDVLPEEQGKAPLRRERHPPVAPGKAGQWEFNLPARARAGDSVFLQFHFVTSRPDHPAPVAGLWLIGSDGGSGLLRYPVSGAANQVYAFKVPVPAGARRLNVSYLNTEETTPVTILFDAADSVKLQIHESRFEANYLRALLMVLARLAFFSALGLTAGVVFSFPVAVFVSLALLLVSVVNRWMQQVVAGGWVDMINEDSAGPVIRLGAKFIQVVFVALNALMPSLERLDPLDFLPGGMLISWGLVGKAWLMLACVYAGILALAGAWLFRRRELGLPAD